MTTDLTRLSNALTNENTDTLAQEYIREHAAQIKDALSRGESYELATENGTFIINAESAAAI